MQQECVEMGERERQDGGYCIKISVRNLVEFILRSGDIDQRKGRAAQLEAMQEGARIHRKIQARMGSAYMAEVPLKIEIPRENYNLRIEGRADGILVEDEVTIDEIKGVYMDVASLEEPIPVHLAQAKCYAFLYARMHGLQSIRTQMTYCNLDTEEIKRFVSVHEFGELAQWFADLVSEYGKWADFQYVQHCLRQSSIARMEFPFPYREGQKDLVKDVYRTIFRKKILFLQAPTGVGKTISVIYPAVQAIGQGLGEKIFYLTAKTVTATVALDTFALLQGRGYHARTLLITAKEKMCLLEEMECNPDACPYARGHYDRVNGAVFELLQKEHLLTRKIFWEQARKHQVCPYELCLDTALWVDHIICDYNYVFDPNAYLRRFFSEDSKEEYLFLVDEAHNLVERGREMYSATLEKEAVLAIKKIMAPYSRPIAAALAKCNRILLEYKRECEDYRICASLEELAFALMRFGAASDAFLQKNVDFPEKNTFLEFYLNVRHFLNMYERVDDYYVIYAQREKNGHFQVRLFCVDPSRNLQECLEKGRSTVFFSATLLPIWYYKKLLSTKTDNYAIYARTAFTKEQSCILVGNTVSTKYTRRNESEYRRIASYIDQIVSAKEGNYMVFFPSYQLLEDVYEQFAPLAKGQVECLLQTARMSEAQRTEFLGEFDKERSNSLVGFCVMGGIFGEGIDLKEDRLIGVVVVGTGIPQVGTEREILKQYFDGQSGEGFDYAYRYPGMNKVLQAAGRVIRTSSDRGVIALLDERFVWRDYQKIFPREWSDYRVCHEGNIAEILRDFWDKEHGL